MCPEVQTLFWTHFFIFILLLFSEMEFEISDIDFLDEVWWTLSLHLCWPRPPFLSTLLCARRWALTPMHLSSARLPLESARNYWDRKKRESQKRFLGVYYLPGAGWFLGHQTMSLGATFSCRQNPDVDGRAQSGLSVWMCLPKFMHSRWSQWVTAGIWSLARSNELVRTVLVNGSTPWPAQWVSYRESGFAESSVFFPWCLCLPEPLLHCHTAQKCYAMVLNV